jgi:hypothetical protein
MRRILSRRPAMPDFQHQLDRSRIRTATNAVTAAAITTATPILTMLVTPMINPATPRNTPTRPMMESQASPRRGDADGAAAVVSGATSTWPVDRPASAGRRGVRGAAETRRVRL